MTCSLRLWIRDEAARSVFTLPWRGRVDRARSGRAGWGGLSTHARARGEITPPRLTFRFAPREATLPLQGRVEFAIGRGAKRSELRDHDRAIPHATSTASAASTASAPSVTVFSSEGACTAKVSAKKRASAT